jgi:RHS repeat-associated protein
MPYTLFKYDSYGNTLEAETDGDEPESGGYKGYDHGAIYFKTGARHYDPNTGTFISPDPFKGYMGDPQSQHPYMYCHGNPVKYSDPSGYEIAEGPTGAHEWDNQDRPRTDYEELSPIIYDAKEILDALHNYELQRAPFYVGKQVVFCDYWRSLFVKSKDKLNKFDLNGKYVQYLKSELNKLGHRDITVEVFGAIYDGKPPDHNDGHQWFYIRIKKGDTEYWMFSESNYKGSIYRSLPHVAPNRKIR